MIINYSGGDQRYESIFFDLDGTITESGAGVTNAVKYMFENTGVTGYDEQMVKSFIGPPVIYHLQNILKFSEERARESYVFFKEYYLRKGIYENGLYDGIIEVIRDIKDSGKKIYIATTKPEMQAFMVLDNFKITGMFDGVFAAKHECGIFSKKEVLVNAVKKLGEVKNAVMVGDRSYDIEGGKFVGFGTVGVLYGYGDLKELSEAGCDFTVDTVEDLSVLFGRR